MPGQPRYPIYQYSAGQYPQPLHPYPSYNGYPPSWMYPQYPWAAGGPVMSGVYQSQPLPPVSPRWKEKRRSSTPPPMELHHLLGARKPSTLWDVSQNPSSARFISPHEHLEKIPISMTNEPATNPPVNKMRIISDEFPWIINITPPRSEIVCVEHVFGAIHAVLQEPMEKEEWEQETSGGRKHLHKMRCLRLSKGPSVFKLDGHIKKLDSLGEKTFFWNLKAVGAPDEPDEWVLKLVPPPQGGKSQKRR